MPVATIELLALETAVWFGPTFCLFVFFFEDRVSLCIVQASLRISTVLSLSPGCWDNRHAPSYPVLVQNFGQQRWDTVKKRHGLNLVTDCGIIRCEVSFRWAHRSGFSCFLLQTQSPCSGSPATTPGRPHGQKLTRGGSDRLRLTSYQDCTC